MTLLRLYWLMIVGGSATLLARPGWWLVRRYRCSEHAAVKRMVRITSALMVVVASAGGAAAYTHAHDSRTACYHGSSHPGDTSRPKDAVLQMPNGEWIICVHHIGVSD